MKRYFFSFIALCFCISWGLFTFAADESFQSLTEDWTFSLQSARGMKDEVDGISLDAAGNTVIGGLFSNTVKFGGISYTAKNGSDMFIEKIDTKGARVWFQQIDSGTNDFLWDLELDRNGDILLSGGYGGKIEFGGKTYEAYKDGTAFYAKLDGKTGDIKWITTAGVTLPQKQIITNAESLAGGNEIKVDHNDNVIITMMASGSTYTLGNTTYKKQGRKDAFIMKLNSDDGKILWSYQFQGNASKQIRALWVNGMNQIAFWHEYIGTIQGTDGMTYTTPSLNYPQWTFWLLSEDGKLLWMKNVESSGYTNVRGAGGDNKGNLYYTGQVQNNMKIAGISVPTTKNGSVFVTKFDNTGKKVWVRILWNEGSDGAWELVVSWEKVAITSTHSSEDLSVYDVSGNTLQENIHEFSTTKGSAAVTIFDLWGNVVSFTSPNKSGYTNGWVLDMNEEGCVSYQLSFRENVFFGNGLFYSNALSDKDQVVAKVCPKQKVLNREELEKKYGSFALDLSWDKWLIICFHGHGWNGENWEENEQNALYLENMKQAWFSYLCPTSIDRKKKQWSNDGTKSNPDVLNVDAFLNDLHIPSDFPLFVMGHSNGGGFVGRYALLSQRTKQIAAVQYSNASGLGPAFSYRSYTFPSAFFYAVCDDIVQKDGVEKNIEIAKKELWATNVLAQKLDTQYYLYNKRENCHQFLDVSKYVIPFFEKSLP